MPWDWIISEFYVLLVIRTCHLLQNLFKWITSSQTSQKELENEVTRGWPYDFQLNEWCCGTWTLITKVLIIEIPVNFVLIYFTSSLYKPFWLFFSLWWLLIGTFLILLTWVVGDNKDHQAVSASFIWHLNLELRMWEDFCLNQISTCWMQNWSNFCVYLSSHNAAKCLYFGYHYFFCS